MIRVPVQISIWPMECWNLMFYSITSTHILQLQQIVPQTTTSCGFGVSPINSPHQPSHSGTRTEHASVESETDCLSVRIYSIRQAIRTIQQFSSSTCGIAPWSVTRPKMAHTQLCTLCLTGVHYLSESSLHVTRSLVCLMPTLFRARRTPPGPMTKPTACSSTAPSGVDRGSSPYR